jgi:hypothetical protein
MERENSAFRLHRFIQRLLSQPGETPTVQALFNTFGIPKAENSRQQNIAVAKVTGLLFEELESLVAELKHHKYSDETIRSITNPFDRLSVGHLASPWKQNAPVVNTALPLLRSIGEAPNLLTDDGTPVSVEDLAALTLAISELRKEVEESDLPPEVKQFVFEQLNTIANAILAYPLSGIKAFKAAAKEAVFHQFEHLDILAQYSDKPQLQRLKEIQEQVVKASRFAIEFSKLLSAADTIYQQGSKVLQSAGAAAHHLSGWLK